MSMIKKAETTPSEQEQLSKARQRKSQAKPKTESKTFTRGETATKPIDADTLANKIKRNAQAQASQDAQRIVAYGRQVYAAELEKELHTLLGGSDMRDFFRAESSGWTLPNTNDPEQLASPTVDALPSAD